jgi:prolipoprotein diacylglyceryltransferase
MTSALPLQIPFRWLTRWLRPQLVLFRRPICAYQVWGVAGLLCAIPLAADLSLRRGLELPIVGSLLAGAIATFFGLVMAIKIVTGRETIVYYQHEIAILAEVALLGRLLGRPVLPYLDISAIAVGCFLAFGRIGCLMVGCCHGRPARAGILYGLSHAKAGFSFDFVGVPLLPVQAIESAWVFLIVAADSVWMARGSRPGEAFAAYVAAYAVERFILEYWRGDPHRPYWKGSSTAQWISAVSAALVMRAEFGGRLPFHYWHVAVAAVLAGLVVWNAYRDTDARRLRDARHIGEIAAALSGLGAADPAAVNIPVARTSLGICISHGTLRSAAGASDHYTFSRQSPSLTPEQARELATLTRRLRGHSHACLVSRGVTGAWHLVFADSAPEDDRRMTHGAADMADPAREVR